MLQCGFESEVHYSAAVLAERPRSIRGSARWALATRTPQAKNDPVALRCSQLCDPLFRVGQVLKLLAAPVAA